VLKVADNCSAINGGFGAVAAVSETQDDFRYVPEAVISSMEVETTFGQ
jgi:hypothetical protein